MIDELTLYDRALTAAEVLEILLAGSAGKCKLSQSPAEALEALSLTVVNLDLQHGISNSLDRKLERALAFVNDSKNTAAINALNAFINKVKAQSGKKIPVGDANAVIAEGQRITGLLSG